MKQNNNNHNKRTEAIYLSYLAIARALQFIRVLITAPGIMGLGSLVSSILTSMHRWADNKTESEQNILDPSISLQ